MREGKARRFATVRTMFPRYHPDQRRRLFIRPYWPKVSEALRGIEGRRLTAKDAKYGFRRLIDLARAEPVAVAKRGLPVVVVMAVEEFERLKALDTPAPAPAGKRKASA
jgi:prevent-host-death family protein